MVQKHLNVFYDYFLISSKSAKRIRARYTWLAGRLPQGFFEVFRKIFIYLAY